MLKYQLSKINLFRIFFADLVESIFESNWIYFWVTCGCSGAMRCNERWQRCTTSLQWRVIQKSHNREKHTLTPMNRICIESVRVVVADWRYAIIVLFAMNRTVRFLINMCKIVAEKSETKSCQRNNQKKEERKKTKKKQQTNVRMWWFSDSMKSPWIDYLRIADASVRAILLMQLNDKHNLRVKNVKN